MDQARRGTPRERYVETDEWDDDAIDDRRPRRSFAGRVFSLLKLALFLTPMAIFAYGYLAGDCRGSSGSGGGFGQIVTAGVCARNEIVGHAFSLQDNLAALRRVVN